MIKIAITGVCGRMGKSIASVAAGRTDMEIVGATEATGHRSIGCEMREFVADMDSGLKISEEISDAAADADVIIDFTSPEATLAHAEHSVRNSIPMVIGTTGFSPEQREKLLFLLPSIPCVFAPNMSVGINMLIEVSRQVAACLGDTYDAEIVEAHHRKKTDSPSGTSLALAEAVADGLGTELSDAARYERYGRIGARPKGEIGIQTIRGGDVVGDHTVMFLGDGERIELSHRATARENFSLGALRAAEWIVGKSPRIYTMRDVLGF